eukprot:16247545-Heterocapsa_arctica.AAC.1
MGRNIRIKLAKKLCEMVCGCEWDRPFSFEALPAIEEALKSHVLVLDLDNPSIFRAIGLCLPIADVQERTGQAP